MLQRRKRKDSQIEQTEGEVQHRSVEKEKGEEGKKQEELFNLINILELKSKILKVNKFTL